jgi:putative hydrolase of the HAD superfamily
MANCRGWTFLSKNLVLLIDLDDTLTDRITTFDNWADGFMRRHRLPQSASTVLTRLDRRGLRPRPEFLAQVAAELDLVIDPETELEAYRAQTLSPPAMPGVRSRLSRIRQDGGAVIVLSNGVSDVQRRKLANADLLGVVDDVMISDATGVAKPAHAAFDLAIDRARQIVPTPGAVWMVGDSAENDIRGALACGLLAAWVNRTAATWHGDPRPQVADGSTAVCLDRILEWR